MAKVDPNRDYYGDLEVPRNASVEDIKKQFRKLALKYHPDRNPGREAEVNSKFQVIQSAHEILTDDNLRRKYDDATRNKAGRASGVRGNPWQDAAKFYPPPPRRPGAPASSQSRPSAGAHRYSSFANGVPRPAKSGPREDPRGNYDAWNNMRSSSRTRNPPPPTPGRAPTSAARNSKTSDSEGIPRTASQKQKAQASFGNTTRRTGSDAAGRTGFVPRSPGVEDEPPVNNKNYFTTRTHTNIFNEAPPPPPRRAARPSGTSIPVPDPLAQFRENLMDGRQSTPYHTPGGEKTSLFDEGSGLGRARSTREASRKAGAEEPAVGTFPFPQQRPRSASTPRSSSNDGGSEDSTKVNTGQQSGGRRSSNNTNPFAERASDRYKPKFASSDDTDEASSAAAGKRPATSNGNEAFQSGTNTAQTTGRPSLYATPSFSLCSSQQRLSSFNLPSDSPVCQETDGPSCLATMSIPYLNNSSSGGFSTNRSKLCLFEKELKKPVEQIVSTSNSTKLCPFEKELKKSVEQVIEQKGYPPFKKSKRRSATDQTQINGSHNQESETYADHSVPSSFNFSSGDASRQTQSQQRFTRNSADNISTKFVQDEHPDEWQFTAGDASANEPPRSSKMRSRSGSGLGRRSPVKTNARTRPLPRDQSVPENLGDALKAGFSAEEWNEKIGSHHFVPQPSPSASASPTRRANSRKNSKPVKPTMGTAGLVDDESSAGEGWQEIPRPLGTDSPNAMDIDTPPPEKTYDPSQNTQKNGVRNIHVEPSRPEWRAGSGNFAGVHPALDTDAVKTNFASQPTMQSTSAPTTANPFFSHNGGSEDSQEFRASFADLKKVEPFTDPVPSGLKSFADMKSTLPFESKPSEEIPLMFEKVSVASSPLMFPTPPVAPRLPPTMAVSGIRPNAAQFRKYTNDFYVYMDKWEIFNQQVITHFQTRQDEHNKRRQENGSNWLLSGSGGDGARLYALELEQDHDVRKQWTRACDEHQMRIREFLAFKERVK